MVIFHQWIRLSDIAARLSLNSSTKQVDHPKFYFFDSGLFVLCPTIALRNDLEERGFTRNLISANCVAILLTMNCIIVSIFGEIIMAQRWMSYLNLKKVFMP